MSKLKRLAATAAANRHLLFELVKALSLKSTPVPLAQNFGRKLSNVDQVTQMEGLV